VNSVIVLAITNPASWDDAFHNGRAEVKKKFHTTQNACAAVASRYMQISGLIDKYYLSTTGLHDALCKLKWKSGNKKFIKITDYRKLIQGDVAFAKDWNKYLDPKTGEWKKVGSDHVFIIYKHEEGSSYAMVLDNYETGPHTRNLLEGDKTPFDFALRYVEEEISEAELGTISKQLVLGAFKVFYSKQVWDKLPQGTRKLINGLRSERIFN
jgi:hypothetical protein